MAGDKCGFFGDFVEIKEGQKLQCGAEFKFLVLKIADVNSALNSDQIRDLFGICQDISRERKLRGKGSNEYLVINVDEPYAQQVIEIMKAHGHWGVGHADK